MSRGARLGSARFHRFAILLGEDEARRQIEQLERFFSLPPILYGAVMSTTLTVAFITFFVVIDPIGVAAMFAVLTHNDRPEERRRVAIRGVTIAALVLVLFAFGGDPLLRTLGIGLPAFKMAGGILLLLLAIDMVMARPTGLRATTPGEDEESSHRADISVFPVAIPLIAGPGALTSTVMMMTGAAHDALQQVLVVAMLLAVLAITLVCLLMSPLLMKALGLTGSNVITRIFGILLCALSMQFMIDGVFGAWRSLS
jgi:multiple antibiotic resistance protein